MEELNKLRKIIIVGVICIIISIGSFVVGSIMLFKHFENKKLTDITFKKQEEIPFNKTHLVQNFIKNNI